MPSFCHIIKEKILSKNSTKSLAWKLVPAPFVFTKNKPQPLSEKKTFEAGCLYRHVLAKLSKFVRISTRPPQIPFTEDSLKIKMGLELVSRPYFSYNFLIKNFFYINWPNFITRLCLLPKLFNKMCFVLYA